MNYAWIEDGIVTNLIWLYPGNANEFPKAVPYGDVPVQIGDTYDGEHFYRGSERVLTQLEESQKIIAELDEALIEIQYQSIIGGLE